MDSVLSVIQSPVFIGLLLFLGFASLIRVMVARDPGLKRNYDDRRQSKNKKPEFPLIDSDGIEVTTERRVLVDRRRHRILAMEEELKGNGIPG